MTALTSASSRPLALRMRPDLATQRQQWQGREYWTVKDPLALRYYRFEDEEFAILSMLDGHTSAEQIRLHFEQRFAPQQLPAAHLQSLLGMLHRSNLLVGDAPGQGDQLLARSRERQRRRWVAALTNILAIRLRGVDPDRLLTWLNRRVGWVFAPPTALAATALTLCAALLVAVQFDVLLARLPAFHAFFAAQNWLWLGVTLCITKILHEFGHGLACKRFGGECHEMGVMLLVFTPCLYCNVSDAWMIPSKWRRVAIGAAGIYIELILASFATLLWWFSEPGLFNHLCLNVMFVCSVSTLLFNANPLMRFDGYYILSDLVEIPNLRQKSSTIIQRKFGSWIFGLQARPDPFLPVRRQWLFAAYSITSALYGWFVALAIFWFLYQVLEPYGLKVLGQLLVMAMIGGLVVGPLVRLSRFLMEPVRSQDVNKLRGMVTLGAIAAAAIGLACVPLPYYVPCPLEIQPRDADSVYVDVPGALREVLVHSGPVAAGQPIARLDNVGFRLAHERLIAQRAALAARIESIRQRAHSDDSALLELSQTEEALLALDQQIARLAQDLGKLTIRAPRAGLIVPAPSLPKPEHDRTQLVGWTGRPLNSRNVGALLEASTLVCRIAQPGQLEAILALDQSELDFVQPGQRVDLFLTSLTGERRVGQIERIAEENMRASSARLAATAGGHMATRPDSQGVQRRLTVIYRASVPLDDPADTIAFGSTGLARVHAGWQPVWQRLWRAACRTFHFDL